MSLLKTTVKKLNYFLLVVFASLSCILFVGSIYNQSKVAYADEVYNVSYNLDGVVVEDEANHQTAEAGVDFEVVLKPDEENGYFEFVPDSIEVWIAGAYYEDYSFSYVTGALTIPGELIDGDIEIVAEANTEETIAFVDLASNGATTGEDFYHVSLYEDFHVNYMADEGKILYPTPYIINVDGQSLLDNTDAYAFDRETGALTIYADYVSGNIVVRWNAQDLIVKDYIANASIEGDPVALTLGETISFQIVPDENYGFPESITLTHATKDSEAINQGDYTYYPSTGLVTVPGHIVTDVICVSGSASVKKAKVTYNLTNAHYTVYQEYPTDNVPYFSTWYVNINADTNCELVLDSVVVKINGEVVEKDVAYEFATTGRLWIKKGYIVGDIEITVEATSNVVSITYDLKNFEIADAPTTWIKNTAGLSMMLTYIEDIGYVKPNNKSITHFMVYMDGVAQTDGASQVGWSVTTAYKLNINKATTKCNVLHIVAHAEAIEYTMTLTTDSQGTLKQDSVTYTIETQEDPLADVIESTINGYELDRWDITGSDGGDTTWGNGKYTWQTGKYGNISLNATYKTVSYTITFLSGDHGYINNTSVAYTVLSSKITYPTVTPNDHYSFTLWEIVEGSGSWTSGQFTFKRGSYGNVTVVAKYELTQYKITLDLKNAGTISGPTVLTYTIETETMPDLEIPNTKPAFTFVGWEITSATGSWELGPYVWGGLGSYGDIVVSAQYEAQTYYISFDINQDCNYDTTAFQYTAGDESITLPTVTPKEHLTHDGWIIKLSDGSWVVGEEFEYAQGEYGNITLMPNIVPTTYKITLRTDSKGTLAISTYSYTYFTATAPVINEPVPYNNGYEFSHWEVVETSGSWVAASTYTWKANSYGDVALIARYKALTSTYTVEYWTQALYSDPNAPIDYYVLEEVNIITKTGPTWQSVIETPASLKGFKYNSLHPENVSTQYLTGNGTEVFKFYYDRQVCNIYYNLTNLTQREAQVQGKNYNLNKVVYGNDFYVYLDPAEDYHLNLNNLRFKINGNDAQVEYTKAATSNRLYFAEGAFDSDLEIIAEGRPNFFTITYELTGVKVVDDGTDYTKLAYETPLKIPLELLADTTIYQMPTAATVQVYVDEQLMQDGYLVSTSGGYIQLHKAAASGNVRIVAAAAYKEFTITVKAASQFTIKYNYGTEIVLPESTTPGLVLIDYTFVPNAYNQQWATKYPERIITDINVGAGLYGNITLTPHYEAITYTVTFTVGANGYGLTSVVEYTVLDAYAPETPNFTPNQGYMFDKWVIVEIDQSDCSWEKDKEYVWLQGKHGDIVVQARFKGRSDTKFKINHYFEALNGSFVLNESKTQVCEGTTAESTTAQPLSEHGFSFDTDNPNNELTGTIAANGSLVLNIYYVRNLHNISVLINDTDYGSVDKTTIANVKFGTPVVVQENTATIGSETITATPTDPTTTEVYKFVSWDISGEIVDNDLTIVANFLAETRYYTIVFKNGDTVIKTLSLQYNETPIFDEENPTKENTETLIYTFDGWCAEGDDQVLTTLPAVTGDITYVAHFAVEDLSQDEPKDNMMIIYIAAGGGGVLLIVIILIIVIVKKKKSPKRF